MTLKEIIKLKEINYIRVAQPHTNYWIDFSKNIINDFRAKFGNNFNLIIYSKVDIDTDYYIIPFSVVDDLFKDKFLSKDKAANVKRRWVANIRNHSFKITNNPNTKDIKEYFSNPFYVNKYEVQESNNEYEIENKLQEIKVRLKQSIFRKKVLNNFNFKCCITDIYEEDLLVASHIIPWADKKETRLDPANGLCLSILYDKLFDKGYFTILNDLTIKTIRDNKKLSNILGNVLSEINGKKIRSPINAIKAEYLKYHRENIFLDRNYD